MNNETYESLKALIVRARKDAGRLNSKKRKSLDDTYNLATLYRDIVAVENWISEVAKEYEEVK